MEGRGVGVVKDGFTMIIWWWFTDDFGISEFWWPLLSWVEAFRNQKESQGIPESSHGIPTESWK